MKIEETEAAWARHDALLHSAGVSPIGQGRLKAAARDLALAVLDEARPALDKGTYMICEGDSDEQCAYHRIRAQIEALGGDTP